MSPEAVLTLLNPEIPFKPFPSDVYSLGMTVLHLAKLTPIKRIIADTNSELRKMVEAEISQLAVFDTLKSLLLDMMLIDASRRPSLAAILQRVVQVPAIPRDGHFSYDRDQDTGLFTQSFLNTPRGSDRLSGDFFPSIGNYQAKEKYIAALLDVTATDPKSLSAASSLTSLAEVCQSVGDFEEALTYYEACTSAPIVLSGVVQFESYRCQSFPLGESVNDGEVV